MPKEECLAILRPIIHAACEELLELSRDFVFFRKSRGRLWHEHILNNSYSYESLCGCTRWVLTTQAFRNFRCGLCKKQKSWHNGLVPKWCVECAKERSVCPYCKVNIRIVGHQIRLSHVLRALYSRGIGILIDDSGDFFTTHESNVLQRCARWNTLRDNLNDQELPTLQWLVEVLTGKK